MVYSPSTPPQDERAALSELGRIEAVVHAAPTVRVRARAFCALGRLLRAPEAEMLPQIDEYYRKWRAGSRVRSYL